MLRLAPLFVHVTQALQPATHQDRYSGDALLGEHYGVAEDRGCACVRNSEQNDAAGDAGWLLHRVRPMQQRRDRLVIEPCNKARWRWT